jgi:cysteine desulfurase
MFAPVYLDHNATTPLVPDVLEAMLPWLTTHYGNASSRHEYGRAARRAIDEARQQVAAAVNAHPTEVLFTSGGSESNNLFLKGAAASCKTGVLAVGSTEHPCVRQPALQLQRQGWQLGMIPVDSQGYVTEADFAEVLAQKPRLISLMLANNETGVIQPIAALAEAARSACRPWFHSDAVQAFGKIEMDFRALNAAGVQAITLSSHKIYGPKGAAALIVDKRVELQAQIAGGGHERGLRSGTENVAAIVGFGVACELAARQRVERSEHSLKLREQLESGLQQLGATVFGQGERHDASLTLPTGLRLPNTSYFAFRELDGETLVGKLDRAGFAVASGAACSSASTEPSPVLQAMQIDPALARGAVRVSFGQQNTPAEVEQFLTVLSQTVRDLQGLTALQV